jgi:hypothetical protein
MYPSYLDTETQQRVQMIEKYSRILKYSDNVSHIDMINAIRHCPFFLQDYIKQSPAICLLSAHLYGDLALRHAQFKTEKVCLAAIRKNPEALKYVENQTYDMCFLAVSLDGCTIRYVKEQSEELCILACNNHPCAIYYITNQTPAICRAALSKKGINLRDIKEQTEELCMLAIENDPSALYYVKDKTFNVCIAALKKKGSMIQYISNPSLELCKIAVESDYTAIAYFTQTEEICRIAFNKNPNSVLYMKPEFKILFDTSVLIKPSNPIPFPSHLNPDDFTDPISFDSLQKDSIYGFLVENDKWYLAGSLTSFNHMIAHNVRNSSKHSVFVPIKNCMVSTSDIIWVKF